MTLPSDFDAILPAYDRMAARDETRRRMAPLFLDLLEIFEGCERLAHEPGSPVDQVRAQLAAVLSRQGVTPCEVVGQSFDPYQHEAVGRSTDPAAEPGTIVGEVRRGYLWEGALLRPSRVIVAVRPSESVEEEAQP